MKILYIERRQNEYVSIEKVFRNIAAALPSRFETVFQPLPYGLRPLDTLGNLLFFRKESADIYHITGHVNYIALLFSPANTVLTMHDLRFLHTNGRLRNAILKKLYLDLPVRRLNYITAVSEHTKREIVENTGCDPAKIRVLTLPVIAHTSKAGPKGFDKRTPVILQVGTMPNKNIERLIAALKGITCKLRIIGKLSDKQKRLLEGSKIRFESVFDLSDQEMSMEYEGADIVTFCSTYEGFGLPIVEAQILGKPVVTSCISPMTETSGGAACLVDPFDVESMRSGIERIIADDEYRQDIVKAGLANARRYRPVLVARTYEQLYDEIFRDCAATV